MSASTKNRPPITAVGILLDMQRPACHAGPAGPSRKRRTFAARPSFRQIEGDQGSGGWTVIRQHAMNTSAKWTVIILLLVASALMPFVIVTRDQMGSEGYKIWVLLVIYAYAPAMLARDGTAWMATVFMLCAFSVIALTMGLITNTVSNLEFMNWVNLAAWVNLLSWALAAGSRLAGRYGRNSVLEPPSSHSARTS
jgi:hypothetical protein